MLLFIFPWWVGFGVAIIALLYFHNYYEIVGLGIVIDSLYNAPVERFYHFQFVITTVAIVLMIVVAYIKPRLRFYSA